MFGEVSRLFVPDITVKSPDKYLISCKIRSGAMRREEREKGLCGGGGGGGDR